MVHLRRTTSPYWWPIPRKAGGVWAVRPSPGPHSLAYSIPLALVVRDVLRYAKTLREARMIISRGYIKVDGVVRRNYKFPVGLMDVVEIVPTGEIYRVVPDERSYYALVPITSEEADLKLLRVEGKTAVKGGRLQVHFHDGRNLIMPAETARQIKTFDSVLYDLKARTVRSHIPMRLGVYAVVTHGGNVGFHGQLSEIVWTLKRRQSVVLLKRGEEAKRTILDYIMAVGAETPVIKISP